MQKPEKPEKLEESETLTIQNLIEEFGEHNACRYMEKVRDYCIKTGKRYDNHVTIARQWLQADGWKRKYIPKPSDNSGKCPACGQGVFVCECGEQKFCSDCGKHVNLCKCDRGADDNHRTCA